MQNANQHTITQIVQFLTEIGAGIEACATHLDD